MQKKSIMCKNGKHYLHGNMFFNCTSSIVKPPQLSASSLFVNRYFQQVIQWFVNRYFDQVFKTLEQITSLEISGGNQGQGRKEPCFFETLKKKTPEGMSTENARISVIYYIFDVLPQAHFDSKLSMIVVPGS